MNKIQRKNGRLKGENEEVIKSIKLIKNFIFIIVVVILLNGCDSSLYNSEEDWGNIQLELDVGLNKDSNGFYHLILNRNTWQTLHRVSGKIIQNGNPMENLKVNWESSHFWYIGDTLGYVVKKIFSHNSGNYVMVDTMYVTQFNGFEVPTINCCSYSNMDGEVNTMLAPVKSMVGDTITVLVSYYDDWDEDAKLISKSFKIVLD